MTLAANLRRSDDDCAGQIIIDALKIERHLKRKQDEAGMFFSEIYTVCRIPRKRAFKAMQLLVKNDVVDYKLVYNSFICDDVKLFFWTGVNLDTENIKR